MAFRKADLLLPLCLVSAILLNVYAAVDPTGFTGGTWKSWRP